MAMAIYESEELEGSNGSAKNFYLESSFLEPISSEVYPFRALTKGKNGLFLVFFFRCQRRSSVCRAGRLFPVVYLT